MGQTLTHGVYLPEEGERNCYDGLASNWSILDGAVGTIAEHTTALSGKAPLVHTHGNITNDGKVGTAANKPLITGTGGAVQAGSFGTAANTFCEGNDSRLSDARTPVAHTHTKADVTDLLNSNFIPSANNSYDLGSSSYQWNNLYAKNYYYNGVAWGLDKANEWSADQTFSAKILTKTTNTEISGEDIYQCLKSDGKRAISFRVNNNSNYRTLLLGVHDTNNSPPKGLVISNDNSNNITIFSDSPASLGTSTNKWKTLNGVNPGALSLPNVFDSYDVVTTNWSTSYSQPNNLQINGTNPTYPGWLFIRLDDCTAADDFLIVRYYATFQGNLTFFGSFIPASSSYVLAVPIQAEITTKVWVSKLPTYCKYYASLGAIK